MHKTGGFLMKATKTIIIFTIAIIVLIASVVFADASEDTDKTLSPYFQVKSDDPEVDQLPLLLTSAEVNIAGVIADVTVTQVYKNEGTRPLEAIYVFPASTRAAVYGMTMTIGDRTIFAQIRERQKARQEYEQAKQEGKTASLLEQQRPNVFQMNVANILPGDNIKVELKYTELLVPTDGVYEFVYPTVVGPRYSSPGNAGISPASDKWVANPYLPEGEKPTYLFDVTTHLSTGIPIQEVSCSSHQVDIEYEGPTAAAVTLEETEIIEKIKRMEPKHIERLTEALEELYVGEDFASLPAFYHKVFQIVTNSSQSTEEVVEQHTIKKFTGDRDYILKYRLTGGKIESGLLLYQEKPTPDPSQEGKEENFFLLMVQPPERVKFKDIPPREYIFIVDVSGSMHGFPLDISKTLLRDLISNLRSTDTFNVLLFAGGSSIMAEHSLPATRKNIERAIRIIDNEQGGGGTELLPALKRALNLPKTEGVSRTIVIATDGYVDVEFEAFDLIRNNLNQANMFTFGIGKGINRFLVEGMARVGQGEPFVVTESKEAAGKAAKFRKYIQTPVLTGINCDFDVFNVYDVEPISIPDVLAERPVIVFGKWKGQPTGTITLRGYSGEGRYERTFTISDVHPLETNAALRYLWARKRIEILGDYNTLLQENYSRQQPTNQQAKQQDEERIKEITRLGLAYNLLTKYTSFVAIDQQIRNKEGNLETVKQPLPLPQGVSNYAVGGGAIPEPTTIVLLGLGLVGIIALRRRHKILKKRDTMY
jgi:Ca-activated chloride channel family protein